MAGYPVAAASFAGKSRHMAREPRPSCRNTSVGAPSGPSMASYSRRCPPAATRGMRSHSEMPVEEVRLGLEFGNGAIIGDAALDENDGAVGDGRDRGEVLVDDHRGDAGRADAADDRPDLLGDERRQAFRRLVE